MIGFLRRLIAVPLSRGASPASPGLLIDSSATARDLQEVLESVLSSLLEAKKSMDRKSAELARVYWADPVLRSLAVPAFNLPEITLNLRFAVDEVPRARTPSADGKDGVAMTVIVDTPTLIRMPEHLVSCIEIKLTMQEFKAYTAEGKERTAM
jgi:hypothetical protein